MAKINSIKPTITAFDTRIGSSPSTERIRGGRLRKIRERIGIRDEYTCRLCYHVTVQGQVDHITPLYMGGHESDDNRQWLCAQCHKLKSEREEGERR